jgi:hypothetical protein
MASPPPPYSVIVVESSDYAYYNRHHRWYGSTDYLFLWIIFSLVGVFVLCVFVGEYASPSRNDSDGEWVYVSRRTNKAKRDTDVVQPNP